MSYSSAAVLQMPSSYVPMSSEEMEYLEGGATYVLYTGWSGWRKLSSIITQVAGIAIEGKALQGIAAGCAATANPIGFISAILTSFLGYVCYGLSGVQMYNAGAAALYMVRDNGFKAADESIWKWTYTSVKSRYAR